MNLIPLITSAGLAAVLNATNDGFSARIVSIVLGDAAWQPELNATSLQNERARVSISSSTRVNPTQIHLTAIESGEVEYWVREIGFVLDDGTLLAVWSQPDETRPLAYKAAAVDLLLGFDLVLSALPDDSVTVEDSGGLNLGPATVGMAGVVKLATLADAQNGERDDIAMTPKTTQALLTPATSTDAGFVRFATESEAQAGLRNDVAMSPSEVKRIGDENYQQWLALGPVQLTPFLNNFDAVIDYTTPEGTFMVGLNSFHNNGTEDRRWRVRYQRIDLQQGRLPPIIKLPPTVPMDPNSSEPPLLTNPIS